MATQPLGLTPLISVFDMVKSAAFYTDLLGFEVVASSPVVETPEGRFSHWMWLRFGGAELMLNTKYDSGERPLHPDATHAAWHGDTCLYIGCPDVDAVYEELTRRGLRADPVAVAPYGLKMFGMEDPDGYKIVFQEAPR